MSQETKKHPTGKSKVTVRRWRPEDIPALHQCQLAAYQDFPADNLCEERHFEMQLEAFPEGQYLAEVDGKVVGYAASLIVVLDDDSPWYSYSEITGSATFSTHDPSGDTLYGADIAVHPDYRGRGIAAELYKKRKGILKRYNLRRMVAGGRISGYRDHVGEMTAEEYVERVKRGELKDMALNAHLKAGYEVKGVHLDYLTDEASVNYATSLEYVNPDFHHERRKIAASAITRPVRRVRICAAQYEMRRIDSWAGFEQQVMFFVDTAYEYHCHFLLFPELFTAQLFSLMDSKIDDREAMAQLSEYTDRYREFFRDVAQEYGLHIIAGSHPVQGDRGIRNVAHLFTPSGNIYTQDKLHVTPAERAWGIQPGYGLRVFDTPLARIAIQVCYDVEFPESTRLLTLAGAEIIFVPFSTDEKKSYLRVRICAQARAVENYLYTVIAGNVGNLPQVRSFLINYGQAAIFTPSDFAFPANALAAEADPNTETVVITDIDVGTLSLQRELATVRPLRDRRPDLYFLQGRDRVRVIRTS